MAFGDRNPHARRRYLGGRHVLRLYGPAPERRAARSAGAPATLGARVLALLPLGVDKRRHAARERPRHDFLGLWRVRRDGNLCPCHAGHRPFDDGDLRASLFRPVAAPAPRRGGGELGRGRRATRRDPPDRGGEPDARADYSGDRRKRPVLGRRARPR